MPKHIKTPPFGGPKPADQKPPKPDGQRAQQKAQPFAAKHAQIKGKGVKPRPFPGKSGGR